MPTDWNAASYDRVADPQARWGAEVLARLPLEGDETVLDAGCGTGRVTELLLARLPRGRVVALDASASMLDQAKGRLAGFGDRVTYVQANLEQPLPLPAPVDAVLSTATFHWVLNHDALFANLAEVLRPGGWLVAQCGGFGNIDTMLRVATEVDPGFRRAHNFQTAEATRERLGQAGFDRIETWLSDAPTSFDTPEQFEAFLETVCLRTFLDEIPAEARPVFVREVATRLPERTLDYVRLNITARRAAERRPARDVHSGGRHLPTARHEKWHGGPLPKSYVRLTHPLVRDTRGGELRQATWDEALDRTVAGLQAALAKRASADVRAPVGIFSCSKATNEVNYAAQKLSRVVLGSNNIDSCNRT